MMPVFDRNDYLELHKMLCAAPAPSCGEEPRRRVLEAYLTGQDIKCLRIDAGGNLWVDMVDGPWADTVVYDAHLDVVEKGFCESVRDVAGRRIGLGALDDTAAVTFLALFLRGVRRGEIKVERPFKALFSTGEEGGGNLKGMRAMLAEQTEAPWQFVAFDLNCRRYCMAALGSKRYAISFNSPGGHAWNDFGAPNAIAVMAEFLHELAGLFHRLAVPGECSYNLGTASGGEGINSIARAAKVAFEARSINMEWLERFEAGLNALLKCYGDKAGVKVESADLGCRPAAVANDPHGVEKTVLEIFAGHGIHPQKTIQSTNINLPLSHGWPCACFGLGDGGQNHREDEYLIIDSLPAGWAILVEMSAHLLRHA